MCLPIWRMLFLKTRSKKLKEQVGVSSVEVLDKFDSYYIDVAWTVSVPNGLTLNVYVEKG